MKKDAKNSKSRKVSIEIKGAKDAGSDLDLDFIKQSGRDSKEAIYFAVCNSILKHEVSKGHLKWTVSDVARDSKVTRSLIYYYFGKEKQTVLSEAYKFVIGNVFNVSRSRSMPLAERMAIVLQDMKSMPYLLVLYYLAKVEGTEFAQMIHKAEAELFEVLSKEFPDHNKDQILAVYLKQLGALMYQLPPDQASRVF